MVKTHMYKDRIKEICNKEHLTAKQIFEQMKKIHPNIWLATIYRNLNELKEIWELKTIQTKWSEVFYELNIWNHWHLIDQETGKITDFDVSEIINKKLLPTNFDTNNIEINVYWSWK